MPERFNRLLRNSLLLRGSFIVLAGSTFANFGSYLFHLLAGRYLGPERYGLLESLISLMYFLSIPLSPFSVLIVRLASQKKDQPEQIAVLIKTAFNRAKLWGLVALSVYLFSFPFFKSFLKIDSFLVFLGVGLLFYLGIFPTIITAVLQGRLEFWKNSLMAIMGSWAKIFFALPLFWLGYRVGGTITAMVFGVITTLALGLYLLKGQVLTASVAVYQPIRQALVRYRFYLLAVMFNTLATTAFFTTDVILARRFLPAVESGYYAAGSVLGKIIFFGSSAIISVMFPVVASKYSRGEDYRPTLWASLAFVILVSSAGTLFYFAFPELVTRMLFGEGYLAISGFLGLFALFLSIYSLCSLLLSFYLSVGWNAPIYFSALAAVFQAILIFFFHQGINQILVVNLVVLAGLLLVLFACLFWWFGHNSKKE